MAVASCGGGCEGAILRRNSQLGLGRHGIVSGEAAAPCSRLHRDKPRSPSEACTPLATVRRVHPQQCAARHRSRARSGDQGEISEFISESADMCGCVTVARPFAFTGFECPAWVASPFSGTELNSSLTSDTCLPTLPGLGSRVRIPSPAPVGRRPTILRPDDPPLKSPVSACFLHLGLRLRYRNERRFSLRRRVLSPKLGTWPI